MRKILKRISSSRFSKYLGDYELSEGTDDPGVDEIILDAMRKIIYQEN